MADLTSGWARSCLKRARPNSISGLLPLLLLSLLLVFGGCAGRATVPDPQARPGEAPSDGAVPGRGVAGGVTGSGTLFPAEPVDPAGPGTETLEGVIVGHARGAGLIARSGPSDRTSVVAALGNPTDVGGPLVVQLVEDDRDRLGPWVEVRLPIRPNGTTGWVRRDDLVLSRNPWRIDVWASEHRLEIRRAGSLWLSTTVGIGTGATPTPRGRFYIIELLAPPNPDGLYGPYAFGLSGFSETLTSFAGGPGVIGIHGTDQPSALGTDVSHGCIRVHNDVITLMADFVPLGTPVTVFD